MHGRHESATRILMVSMRALAVPVQDGFLQQCNFPQARCKYIIQDKAQINQTRDSPPSRSTENREVYNSPIAAAPPPHRLYSHQANPARPAPVARARMTIATTNA